MENLTQIVTFKVNAESFGLPSDLVTGIIRVPEYTKIPWAFSELLGIFNLRGEVVPLIDLSLKLGFEDSIKTDEDSRLIIVENNGEKVGFLVDAVHRISKQYHK